MIAGIDVYKTSITRTGRYTRAPRQTTSTTSTSSPPRFMRSQRLHSGKTPICRLAAAFSAIRFARGMSFDPDRAGPTFSVPQGLPLDTSETQHATHVGIEHRFTPAFAVFGRMAQSFRLPNVDERVGKVPLGGVTNFNLRRNAHTTMKAASASTPGRSICNPAHIECIWSTNCISIRSPSPTPISIRRCAMA